MKADMTEERPDRGLSVKKGDPALVLTCISGKGGQGASLLSLYLSSMLATSRHTLLIDLDPHSVHRNFLEDPDCPGLANLIMVREGVVSIEHESFTRRHPCGFDLLTGPRGREEWAFLSRFDIDPVVAELSLRYEVIVLDISSSRMANLLKLATTSSLNLLVMRPDLVSARCILQLLEEMDIQGGGEEPPVALVSNCSRPSPLLHPERIASALRMPLLTALPYDQVAGEDFASFFPNFHGDSPLGASIRRLAAALGLIETIPSHQERKRPTRCLRALLSGVSAYRPRLENATQGAPKRGLSCAR